MRAHLSCALCSIGVVQRRSSIQLHKSTSHLIPKSFRQHTPAHKPFTAACSGLNSLTFISRSSPALGSDHTLNSGRYRISTSARNLATRTSALCSKTPDAYVPLYERPAEHVVTEAQLSEFIEQARDRALKVGDTYTNLDGGPNSRELLREIDWLLDDAIAATRSCNASASSPSSWSTTTWKELCRDMFPNGIQGERRPADVNTSREVLSRECMVKLGESWRQRIEDRVPFQYIVAAAHWRDEVLAVGPGVLIPRPETEIIIDLCADALNPIPDTLPIPEGAPWVDLGTGSGALAIGLARVLPPQTPVIAVDISPSAASVARFNIQRCGMEERVEVREGDWFEGVGADLIGRLGGVVSNPPYIPSEVCKTLQAEVIGHEPLLALDGGDGEGLDDLDQIVVGAKDALLPGGMLVLETGGGNQPQTLVERLERSGHFERISTVKDLGSIERFVIGFRR